MLLTKEVEVRLNTNNYKHYKQLGYNIPMREASKSMKYSGVDYVIDFGNTILVKVEDLPLNSVVLVESTCDYCGELKPPTRYSDYNKQTKNGTVKCCCSKCASLKHKEVMIEKYGYEKPIQVPEIRDKFYNTNMEKYGYNIPAKSPKIREKIVQSFYYNSSQKASKQQRYINNLYNGVLNFPVKYYNIDVYLPYDNLAIEFDGSGHMISVLYGDMTMEEYKRNEIIRGEIIKSEGYKQMKIVSNSNKLPSDEILLKMLNDAKKYFSDYPNHSWIEFIIDTSTVRCAEHKDGVYFNYGELRTIKKTDLDLYDNVV